jgi:hypothetical protein
MEDFLSAYFDQVDRLVCFVLDGTTGRANMSEKSLAAELCAIRIAGRIKVLEVEIKDQRNAILAKLPRTKLLECFETRSGKAAPAVTRVKSGLFLSSPIQQHTDDDTDSSEPLDFLVEMDESTVSEFRDQVLQYQPLSSRSTVTFSYTQSPSHFLYDYVRMNEETIKIPIVGVIQPVSISELSLLSASEVIKTLFFQTRDTTMSDFLKTIHPVHSVLFPRIRKLCLTLILSENGNATMSRFGFQVLYKLVASLVRTVRTETLEVLFFFMTETHGVYNKEICFTPDAEDLLRCIDVSKRIICKCCRTGRVFYQSQK